LGHWRPWFSGRFFNGTRAFPDLRPFFSFFPGSWLKGNYATRELGNVPCGFSTCFISASLNAVALKLLLGTFKPMLLFVVNGSFTASLYFCELVTSICHSSTFSLRQIFPKSLE
jgi:hypothetical protein